MSKIFSKNIRLQAMKWFEIFFWISVSIVFYAYIGYGVLMWVLLKIKFLVRKSPIDVKEMEYPSITLIIPAFNEEEFIGQKIQNTIELDYPANLLEVIFITDGSSDRTPEILSAYPQFTLMHSSERKGKIAAANRAMQAVKTPYVIFCDANTLLNAASLKEIVKHYSDPKTGGVAGEKKVVDLENSNSAAASEGIYWKYESMLKKFDSDLYTVVGAAGELFSFRTELYEPVEEDTLLDDFIISLRICQKGFRVAYEPNAYAVEKPSANIKEEKKRKIRISAGAFQSMIRLRALLNIFKYPVLSFQYVSHRVLRWALCPFLLPVIAVLNIVLVFTAVSPTWVYQTLLASQVAFYIFAFIGWSLSTSAKKAGIFNFPYYFVFMNASLYLGLKKYLKGSQSVL